VTILGCDSIRPNWTPLKIIIMPKWIASRLYNATLMLGWHVGPSAPHAILISGDILDSRVIQWLAVLSKVEHFAQVYWTFVSPYKAHGTSKVRQEILTKVQGTTFLQRQLMLITKWRMLTDERLNCYINKLGKKYSGRTPFVCWVPVDIHVGGCQAPGLKVAPVPVGSEDLKKSIC
jgi:hypothetical protein